MSAMANMPRSSSTDGSTGCGSRSWLSPRTVNRFLKLTLTIFVETRAALWGYLMTRVLGRGDGYQLRMIHNVRPAVELPGSSRWTALTITFGILMVSAALLLIALRS